MKKKRPTEQKAKDLYCSPLWVKRRAYAEASGHQWLILGAQHGLVDPDDVLEPYDLSLSMLNRDAQRRWATNVAEAVAVVLDSISSPVVEFHAGMDYQRFLRPLLEAQGITIVYPLEGLTQGVQLGWYKSAGGSSQRRRRASKDSGGKGLSSAQGFPSVSAGQVRATADQILHPASRVRAANFRTLEQTRLRSPGIYSWWADDAVRAILGDVLQTDIPDLIYVGQAGATKWPSGKRSSATLWTQTVTQHLSGGIGTSTFRFHQQLIVECQGNS